MRFEISFCPPVRLDQEHHQQHDVEDNGNEEIDDEGRGRDGGEAKVVTEEGRQSTHQQGKADTSPPPNSATGSAPVNDVEGTRDQRRDSGDQSLVPAYAGRLEEGGGDIDVHETARPARASKRVGRETYETNESDNEPWSRHGRWRLPCFFKEVASMTTADAGGEGHEGLPPLALEVQ